MAQLFLYLVDVGDGHDVLASKSVADRTNDGWARMIQDHAEKTGKSTFDLKELF
jgi:hypothetical protein